MESFSPLIHVQLVTDRQRQVADDLSRIRERRRSRTTRRDDRPPPRPAA